MVVGRTLRKRRMDESTTGRPMLALMLDVERRNSDVGESSGTNEGDSQLDKTMSVLAQTLSSMPSRSLEKSRG